MTRRKHWFRVADSILEDDWDDKTLATAVRLMAYLNTRWARNGLTAAEASEGELSVRQVSVITRTSRRDVGQKCLQRLAHVTDMTIASVGEVTRFSWPKWSEFQGLRDLEAARYLPEKLPSAPAPSPAPSPAPTREEKESGKRPKKVAEATAISPPEAARQQRISRALNLCPRGCQRDQWQAFLEVNLEAIEVYAQGRGEPFRAAVMAFYHQRRRRLHEAGMVAIGDVLT